MFDTQKVEILKKQNLKQAEEIKSLKAQIKELKEDNERMKNIVTEADKYIDIMKKERLVLGEAKTKYDLAYKELMKIKKDYTTKVDDILDTIAK